MDLVSAARSIVGSIISITTQIVLVYFGFLLAILQISITLTVNTIRGVASILLAVKQSITRTIQSIFALLGRIIRNVGHRISGIIWKIVGPIFEIIEIVTRPILKIIGGIVHPILQIIQNIINRIRGLEIVQIIGHHLLEIGFVRSVYDRFINPRIPPGPWGLPIVGNLLQMGDNMGETLMEWKEIYGPVMSVRLGSFNTVVFNDFETVREHFARPACTGRKEVAYFKDVVNGKGIKFGRQNEALGVLRQFMIDRMMEFGLEPQQLEEYMGDEIRDLLDLLDVSVGDPVNVHHMFSAVAVNPFWNCLTRRRFGLEDPLLERLADISEGISELPSGFKRLAHFIPWLGRLFPCHSDYKCRRRGYREVVRFIEQQIAEEDETYLEPGNPRHVSDAFKDRVDQTVDENSCFFRAHNNRPYSFCDILVGATDTTGALLEWTLIYLAVHTDVQKTLQRQIDRRITDARPPALTDCEEIPYAEAIFYEVIRKVPLITMNFGREALQDVEIGNFTIPRGTMLMANFYGFCMDKDVWGDPMNFRPRRFLDQDGNLNIQNMLPFSIGGRTCLSGATAKDQFFLVITSIFQRYSVTCMSGRVNLEGKFGYVVHPDLPNEVVFQPRIRGEFLSPPPIPTE